MKVKVGYRAIVFEEIEVDDKFSQAIPAFDNGDDEVYTKLVEELHGILTKNILGDIVEVLDEQSYMIYEM